jgi:hypothetical protein
MINTKLQSIIDTKSAIGNAIVNKGGTITGETPFFNYAAQIDGISTGTPQTIFAASDGSKWALTNAVNLVNDAGNVTHDFNYWQPANNSTSDPILNVGTVGANISGNIRLVPVNQVNIAQYSNIVINDTTGAKYVGYNGYDAITNPTPTGNTTFNRWLLNNSATGTVLFANTTVTSGGTYNGPNSSLNEANLRRATGTNVSNNYSGWIYSVTTNNGFVYAGGDGGQTVQKFHESNLVFVGNTNSYDGDGIYSIGINNGFIYAAGSFNRTVKKFNESTLAFVGNTANYGGDITTIAINNGFIYVGGQSNERVQKFFESNLARATGTNVSNSYTGTIFSVTTNNGFVYVGGATSNSIQKFYESNLAFVQNAVSYGGVIRSITTNNGFIYIGGDSNETVQKFYESNLAFVGNTASYGGNILSVTTDNGFIYIGGAINQTVQKFYESNLAFVGNTAGYGGTIFSVTTNNNFIYAGGAINQRVQKFQTKSGTSNNQTFYTATKIKE